MPTISGIQAISLFHRSSGVVVQKNRIVANQGEAMLQNMIAEEDALGRELFAGDESVFEFACYDTAGNDQLEAWAEADTEVELVTAGLQENVLWYEPATIKVIKPFSFATKNRNYTRIRISKSGGAHKIWRGVNLLDGAVKVQGFESGWQDADEDGLADGWSQGDVQLVDFESGKQRLLWTSVGGSTTRMFIRFVFPVSGIKMLAYIGSVSYGPYFANNACSLSALDVADNVEVANSEDRQANIETVSDTFFVRLQVGGTRKAGTYTGEYLEFSDVSLRLDGSSEYVPY
jgi:hypothetical protein